MQNSETKINFKSETFKKYFANTSWLFGEKIARIIITFFIGIFLVRFLGPNKFGIYSYALSFITLFSALSILGIEKIVVRDLINHPEKQNSILGTAFFLRIAGTAISLVLIFVLVFLIGDSGITLIMIALMSTLIIFRSVQVIDYYFQAKVISKFSVYAQFGSLVVGSVIKIILILYNAPLIYFGISVGIENFVMAGILINNYRLQKLSLFDWKFDKNISKEILKESWPLIISSIAVTMYMKIDQVMIKHMLGEREVGFYAAAVQLCESWYFVPTVIAGSLFPAILSAKQTSIKLYESRTQKLIDLLTWMSIGIALPVTLFSELIIKILFGSEFAVSAPVLTVYIWAGVAAFIGVASSQYLIAEKLTKLTLYRTVPGLILNIILNLILIPSYGIVGSAYATLISYTFTVFSIGFLKITRKHFKMMLKSVLLITLVQHIINNFIGKQNKN